MFDLIMPHRRRASNEDWVWLYFNSEHDASQMRKHIRAVPRTVYFGRPHKPKCDTYCCSAVEQMAHKTEWAICANVHAPNFPKE